MASSAGSGAGSGSSSGPAGGVEVDVERAVEALLAPSPGDGADAATVAALTAVNNRPVSAFAGKALSGQLKSLADAAFSALGDVAAGKAPATPATDAVALSLQRALSNSGVFPTVSAPNLRVLLHFVTAEPYSPSSTTAVLCINNCTVVNKAGQDALLEVDGLRVLVDQLKLARPAAHLSAILRYLMRVVTQSDPVKDAVAGYDGFLLVVTSILGECIRRRDPPFPVGDGRVDLATSVLKLMYSLGDAVGDFSDTSREDMTQLGILLGDCLKLPHHLEDARAVKRQVVHLLLRMPEQFSLYLQAQGLVDPLLDLFRDDVATVVSSSSSTAINAAKNLTVLTTVLHAAAKASRLFAVNLRDQLLPPLPDMPKPLAEPAALSDLVDPAKVPVVWKQVLFIMKAQEYRTLVLMLNELALAACGDNVGVYAKHVGVGLGIETLMRKGAVPTPS